MWWLCQGQECCSGHVIALSFFPFYSKGDKGRRKFCMHSEKTLFHTLQCGKKKEKKIMNLESKGHTTKWDINVQEDTKPGEKGEEEKIMM